MKVNGFLKHQQVTILIDTGNTNNFIDESIAQNFSISTEDCEPFEVTLADGGTLTCKSKCSNVKLAVQDLELRADLHLLPLGGYGRQMVEGSWRCTMKFLQASHEVYLERKKSDSSEETR